MRQNAEVFFSKMSYLNSELTFTGSLEKLVISSYCLLIPFFFLVCSLFTSTTWSWSAERTSLSMKATSSCLMRSWSLYGQLPTTAIAAATSPQSWSLKMLTQESQSSSEQCLTLKGSFHLEQQHHISCKMKQLSVQSKYTLTGNKAPALVNPYKVQYI